MQHLTIFFAIIFSLPLMERRYSFSILSYIILYLFSALRYDFGNDYMAYMDSYYLIKNNQETHVGNSYLFRLINKYSPNFYILVAILSYIYFYIIYIFIKKNVKYTYRWISICILLLNPYLFYIHLSAMRQTIAILIFVYSINYIYRKNIIKYFLCILIAAGFHKSSLILIPLYFILNKNKISTIMKIFIIMIIIFIFSSDFYFFINKILDIFPQYKYYLNNNFGNNLRSVILSTYFFIFMMCYINELNEEHIIYGKLYLLGTIISISCLKIAQLGRVGMFFDIFMIVVIPNILLKIKNKYIYLFNIICIFSIFILRYISFFNTPLWEKFYIYKTIFYNI